MEKANGFYIILITCGIVVAPIKCQHHVLDACKNSTGTIHSESDGTAQLTWELTKTCDLDDTSLLIHLKDMSLTAYDSRTCEAFVGISGFVSAVSGQNLCHFKENTCLVFHPENSHKQNVQKAFASSGCAQAVWMYAKLNFPIMITFMKEQPASTSLELKYSFIRNPATDSRNNEMDGSEGYEDWNPDTTEETFMGLQSEGFNLIALAFAAGFASLFAITVVMLLAVCCRQSQGKTEMPESSFVTRGESSDPYERTSYEDPNYVDERPYATIPMQPLAVSPIPRNLSTFKCSETATQNDSFASR